MCRRRRGDPDRALRRADRRADGARRRDRGLLPQRRAACPSRRWSSSPTRAARSCCSTPTRRSAASRSTSRSSASTSSAPACSSTCSRRPGSASSGAGRAHRAAAADADGLVRRPEHLRDGHPRLLALADGAPVRVGHPADPCDLRRDRGRRSDAGDRDRRHARARDRAQRAADRGGRRARRLDRDAARPRERGALVCIRSTDAPALVRALGRRGSSPPTGTATCAFPRTPTTSTRTSTRSSPRSSGTHLLRPAPARTPFAGDAPLTGLRQLRRHRLGAGLLGQGQDEEEAWAIMDAAWAAGIRWFDTADGYGGGRSESFIGRWRGDRRPDGLDVTTKVFNPLAEGADRGLARDRIRRNVEGSLERLGVERIDYYLAHEPDPETPLAETVGAFEELVAEGTIARMGAVELRARRDRGGAQARPAGARPELLLASRPRRRGRACCRSAREQASATCRSGRSRAAGSRAGTARGAVPGGLADDDAP